MKPLHTTVSGGKITHWFADGVRNEIDCSDPKRLVAKMVYPDWLLRQAMAKKKRA